MRHLSYSCKVILPANGYNSKTPLERTGSLPDARGLGPGRPLNCVKSMALFVLGINHRSAPLEVREKLAFAPDRQAEALADLAANPGVPEPMLVSTCNGTDIYGGADDDASARAWLQAQAAKAGVALEAHLYSHAEEAATRHAFRVAAGLDSMVLGEPQILGQVKQSVRAARAQGTLGPALDRLFQKTFSGAKQGRREPAPGAQPLPMAEAATNLAQNPFATVSRTHV